VSFAQILVLAIGLAMDATAVAAARGCAAPELKLYDVAWTALLFGAAQAVMPAFGWLLGQAVGHWVAFIDHWIAFAVLGALGIKMLREAASFDPHAGSAAPSRGPYVLLGLALATSIDAFAVGLTLPLLRAPFALAIVTIGVVTTLLTAAGAVAARHFSAMLGRRLDAIGGIVLILLGCKILTEHLLRDT
jgi:manganese efflux pump family protein